MRIKNSVESKQDNYNNIPFSANARFSGREDILAAIRSALDPESQASLPKSIALFGMGGVGKTQIATQYAYHELESFDVILWISADNAISIGQSFRTIADGLGLLESDDERRDVAVAIYKVKKWLATTSLFSQPDTCQYFGFYLTLGCSLGVSSGVRQCG
jgi:hypothetical protein